MRVLIIAAVVTLAGCSAGRASYAMLQADKAIRNARDRGADEQAQFEFTMAQAYLVKAREEAQFSSYKDSVILSRGAADWADKALIAMEAEGRTGSASAADAPGGTDTIAPAGLRSPVEPSPTPIDPAPAPTDPKPKPKPEPKPDRAAPPTAPKAPAIVVPVPAPVQEAKPKLIIVPRGEPEPDDSDGSDAGGDQ